ncbi:hypothetical protein [Ruminococcus champanellensis]|uniref:hypothetical protein n=1 Tax=Ruminococcus champanellensis TaxID=1161942 RepID=UPI0023F00B60|nr:hypothetical protein [Ruminococcus champanellensis]
MEYTFEKMPAAEQIQQLFVAVNWESAQYPQALVHGIANAQSLLTVWDDTQLAGLMTAISDGSMNVFFPYLLIDPKYQGQASAGKWCAGCWANTPTSTGRSWCVMGTKPDSTKSAEWNAAPISALCSGSIHRFFRLFSDKITGSA